MSELPDINVKIRALAYERTHPKTALSQFENDRSFVTNTELLNTLDELRSWILLNFGVGITIPQPGGSLFGGDIADQLPVEQIVSCESVAARANPLQTYFYAGSIKIT